MFADFANVWTIIGDARDVQAGKLYPRSVAGERVVLFRDSSGSPAALIDRCPHRGVALSLGKLCNGIIECPFHGWRFDGTGGNRLVPWNPDAKRELLGATALPLREINGLLWLHTGTVADDEPAPSETLLRRDLSCTVQSAVWHSHWTRAMENMLDMPHLPFVHRRTIGRDMAQVGSDRMDLRWTPTATGGLIENVTSGRERQTRLDFLYPNAMELVIDPPKRTLRIVAVCLPEAENTTRMIFATYRSFARSRLFDPMFRFANRRIAREDQAILESSDPPAIPPGAAEKSVRTDAPTLAFRKLYFERLKGSDAVGSADKSTDH
jgi:phenylpropionate dioxygenase-like ring-hydroxylating dioxygenase large terminal subunit